MTHHEDPETARIISLIVREEATLASHVDEDFLVSVVGRMFDLWGECRGTDAMREWEGLSREETSLVVSTQKHGDIARFWGSRHDLVMSVILWMEGESGCSSDVSKSILFEAAQQARSELGVALSDPMHGVDYLTDGPMWTQPCRMGKFKGLERSGYKQAIFINTTVSGAGPEEKTWLCGNVVEVRSRCGFLVVGRTYRWLFHKTTGDLVGWLEVPATEAVPAPKKLEPVGVPRYHLSSAGVFLRWDDGGTQFVFRNDAGQDDYWCSDGLQRDEATERCGDMVPGKRYRWLWDSQDGGRIMGWREEPLATPKDPMDEIEYDTSGYFWDRPDAVGVITRYNEDQGIIYFVRNDGRPDHFAPKNIQELKARLGLPKTGKRYRFLFKSAKIVGWREEPLPDAAAIGTGGTQPAKIPVDTVSSPGEECGLCGKETQEMYQNMARVCEECFLDFHRTLMACIKVANAMYGEGSRVKLYKGDPGTRWKVNIVSEGRGATGIMAEDCNGGVRGAFEALCKHAISPAFPHPDDGTMEARLDAIGEAAMDLGLGIYGAEDR